jgi:hypothetical protein
VAALKLARKYPELKNIVTMINDSGDRYLSTEVFGHKNELKIPEREHKMDEYTAAQLENFQKGFEIMTIRAFGMLTVDDFLR